MILLLSLLATVGVSTVTHAAEPARVKILFIGKKPDHPFGTHMYMHVSGVLAQCVKLSGNIDTVVSEGWPQDESALNDVRTIVLYQNPAAEFLLDGPHRAKVDELMRRGVGLVTIHWASSVKQKNFERLGPRWMSYLGGTWISNVGLHTGKSALKQLAPKHPICRGWSEYETHDEYYLNPTISPAATPLLEVTAKGKKVVVGWAVERPDGGRAYGTTLGHFYKNFQREEFRRMIVNAILWTAHREVPTSGAPVNLSKQDLALPAKDTK